MRKRRSQAGAVVAVTGGARGIGRATARALARRGAQVAIGDLDRALAEEAAAELPGPGRAFELDVTDRASFVAFVDDVEATVGSLDVLVNNAGIMCIGPFLEEDDSVTRRQVDVNLHGVCLGMKIALPRMVARSRGHVVNVASAVGKAGFAGGASYCASKHAVVGLTEAVHAELRGTGVHLSMVLPGPVNTELTSGLGDVRGGRYVEPEDVAEAIARAVERPRLEVFVPRSLGFNVRVMGALPKWVTHPLRRALGADDLLLQPDVRARAAYEARTRPR